MNIEKELFINGQQPLYGCKGTYTGDFFQAIIDECNKSAGRAAGNLPFMSQAYTYGVIQGKRAERARRKGELFDVDRKLTDKHVNQIAEALKNMDESDRQFLNQIYTLIKMHLAERVAPAQLRGGQSHE